MDEPLSNQTIIKPQTFGNVGIGTTIPGQLLTIGTSNTTHNRAALGVSDNGDVLLNTQGTLFFDNNYLYGTGSYIGPYSNTSLTYDANTQKFSTAGVERMRINSSGNVGIGTTVPYNNLSVVGSAAIGSAAYAGIAGPSNGLIVSGNVGIGTWVSPAKLYINATDGTELLRLSSTSVPSLYYLNITGVSAATGDYRFQVTNNGTTKDDLYLQGNGNVGIGTTVPSAYLNIVNNNGNSSTLLNADNFTNVAGSNNTTFIHTDQPYLSGNNTGTYTGSALEVTTYPNSNSANSGDVLKVGTSDGAGNSFTSYLEVKAQGGNVGISSTSPTAPFTVVGNVISRWHGSERPVVSDPELEWRHYKNRPTADKISARRWVLLH